MSFTHKYNYCLTESIGNDGISRKNLELAIAKVKQAATKLKKQKLRLLEIGAEKGDLKIIIKTAEKIRKNFKNIVILGTGGSSLCGKLLTDLKKNNKQKVYFIDNVDPHSINHFVSNLNFKKTFFIAISKSGETLETISQFIAFHQAAIENVGKKKVKEHFLIITEPKNNVLSKLAKKFAIPTIVHDQAIGGRFSSLTAVGMLPAAICGLDIEKIRQGAYEIARSLEVSEAINGAAVNLCMMEKAISTNIFMPYVDRLEGFASWYRQLWAESLGKKGFGTNPVKAMGTVDQHSQMQLYMDGPKDKFFTFITLNEQPASKKFNAEYIVDKSIGYLKDKTMADVIIAEQAATIKTFLNNKLPCRVFELRNMDEKTIGALFMHFCLETILTGMVLGINPFDQPAVEEGKILARKNLSQL